MPSNRRDFLKTTSGAFFGSLLPLPAQSNAPVQIEVDPGDVVMPISPGFVGFGYETSAVANPGFFSVRNPAMLQYYRTLGRQGLIRIGGNVSDYSHWSPQGAPASRSQGQPTVINQQVVADLGGFARATGWRVMWGLNLGSGTKEEAVGEAIAVSQALGTQLHSFEIGNEVDLLAGGEGRHWKNWDFAAYLNRYLEYKKAIRTALPNAPFSGPDCAGNVDWCRKFADGESHDMKLLTIHYYRSWAGDPQATMQFLLASDAGLEDKARQMQAIAEGHHLAYRFNETNSFSGGGKKGISDAFGAALWCLDYMFLLASCGCSGVNIETDINHLHWLSHYSPIFHDDKGNYQARPTYYGMLAFTLAGKGSLVRLKMDSTSINLRAYATRDERGSSWVVVINKDLQRDATVTVKIKGEMRRADLFRLVGTSPFTNENITLAGNPVSPGGTWSPGQGESVALQNQLATIQIPRASAAFLRFS